MKRVAILMSTYNGSKYLEEQLLSLSRQKNVIIELFVRDDISKDNTVKLLKKFKENMKIHIIKSKENLGPALSFMELVKCVSDKFDYYAFCDQDDVWCDDKLSKAIEKIEEFSIDKPTLYCGSQYLYFDKFDNCRINNKHRNLNFYSSIVRNSVVGCTIVFNRKLLKIIRGYTPEYIEMHDIWIYKVCDAIGGNIIYDSTPHIYYRIHSNNTCGINNNLKSKIKTFMLNFNKPSYSVSKTSKELINGYSSYIESSKKNLLIDLSNYKNNQLSKLKLFFNLKIKSEKILTTLMFKILLLFNKI